MVAGAAADGDPDVEVGVAAVLPVGDVVRLAVFRAGVAAGHAASAVADHDRPVLIGRERARRVAHVERYALAVEHDPLDERIARQAPHRLGTELVPAERLAAPDGVAGQRRIVHGDHEMRPVRAALLMVEVVLEDVDDRVGALLARQAWVIGAVVPFVAAAERGIDDLGAFGIERAVEDPDPVERAGEVRPPPFVLGVLLDRICGVAIAIVVERVAPLAADLRDVFGPALERDVDEVLLERGELVIGVRRVTNARERVDMTAADPALLPRRVRDRHLLDLAGDLHVVVGLARRQPQLGNEPTRSGTGAIHRPLH